MRRDGGEYGGNQQLDDQVRGIAGRLRDTSGLQSESRRSEVVVVILVASYPSVAPLRRLHGPHKTCRFSGSLDPPSLTGMMWSNCNSTVDPQTLH
ncbi:MAG: hypothetical protein QG671_3359 [Actinomycetota bacterium]|nr:hypothetical protein [Actinomycetota bacterium]